MSYVLNLDVAHVFNLIEFAREQKEEERLYQLYLTTVPLMAFDKIESYDTWLKRYKEELDKERNKLIHKNKLITMSKDDIMNDLLGGDN